MAEASHTNRSHVFADFILRFLLFASALVAVVVMVTGHQTKLIPVLSDHGLNKFAREAKFQYSPALIYFVAALSVAGLYALLTGILSFLGLLKPGCCKNVVSHFVIFDVLLLGIVAAATGAGCAVGYISKWGNSHSGWKEICHIYNNYCIHILGSLILALFASILLVLLVWVSVRPLCKRISK